jgi:hypothetical protein
MMIKKANAKDGLTKGFEVGLKELGSEGKIKWKDDKDEHMNGCNIHELPLGHTPFTTKPIDK